MNKTVLVIGIIFLLIGASVVSSTDNIVKDAKNDYHSLESNIESKESLSREGIAHGYIAYSGSSRQPEEVWNMSYGGHSLDFGMSGQQTNDGDYIILGYTASYGAGNFDIWLIKTDKNGTELWNKTYGGINNEAGLSVQQTNDNSYIITGHTGSYGAGESDIWLIKTDETGNMEWNKTFGGTNHECGYDVKQTNENGFVLIGYSRSFGAGDKDVWLIKIDSNGNEQWNKTYGGTSDDSGLYILQTTDEDYIITGSTESYGEGSQDVWLIKTDPDGNEQWNKTYGGIEEDSGYCVEQTIDGGYILIGSTKSYGAGHYDFWLIKTDETGNMEWNKTYGGPTSDSGYFVKQTSDECYIITGGGFRDVLLIKIDSSGNELWNKTYGGLGNEFGMSIQELDYEEYIIFGTTSSYGAGSNDVWLLKVSLNFPPNNVYIDDDFNESTPGWQIDHFDKIQDGIYAVNESGTVYVYSGTYYESVWINKSVNLIGENKYKTIIDGGFSGDVINVTSDYVTISGFTVRYSEYSWMYSALLLNSVKNNTITNNIITSNGVGIHIQLSDPGYNNITGNDLSDNYIGILVGSSSYNKIMDNNANFNDLIGISLAYGSSNNSVTGNDASNNIYGISFYQSCYNNITGNNVNSNKDKGIDIFDSTNNIIAGNNVKLNDVTGIILEFSSNNNHLFHNTLMDNAQNAVDNFNNIWDDGYPSGGNYWDDYTGEDNDGDGIGDTAYPISGGDNEDRYPLMYPTWNVPPDIPLIRGPLWGEPGDGYTYTFNASDINDDAVMYIVDWGDGDTEWTEYGDSGADFKLKHTWEASGKYTIKAQAIDIHGAESDWAEFPITMPRDKAVTNNIFLLRILERFPLLQRLLLIWKWNIV